MNLPTIIVNFKNYEQATGDSAVSLAKVHDKVAKETGANMAVAVNPLDLVRVVEAVEIPVFAQHIDPVTYGSCTGQILPDLVKAAGAYGTLLNHAERPLSHEQIEHAIKRAHETDLFTVVCAADPEEAKIISGYSPGLIAVEPPELIGGDVSITKAHPSIIEKSVESVGQGELLVGAGVKTGNDVKVALALGASGVLLASGVTKAEDPYQVLMDLVSGLSS